MLRWFFRPTEVKWSLKALDRFVSQKLELNQDQVIRRARQLICSEFTVDGIIRGFSANQVAALALRKSAEDAMFYDQGNFVYRGLLTRNGHETLAAYKAANDLMVETGLIDRETADADFSDFHEEIRTSG